jgi:hypothetical protein
MGMHKIKDQMVAFPKFNLLLISSYMQCWFTVIPKYLNFHFAKFVLMVLFCPTFCSEDMNMYLLYLAFTARPVSLLATNEASVFFFV